MGKIALKGIIAMTTLFEPAFAKVNLTLDVLGKREDGYHDLKSVMQTISLRDDIEIDGRPRSASPMSPALIWAASRSASPSGSPARQVSAAEALMRRRCSVP